MRQFTVRTPEALDQLRRLLGQESLPCFVQINQSAPKNNRQLRLQHHWYRELAEQGCLSAGDYEGWCKLHIGIPILRESDKTFDACYTEFIKPLPYQSKLALMKPPFNLHVTQNMTAKTLSKYLDSIKRHFSSQGFVLTQGNDF